MQDNLDDTYGNCFRELEPYMLYGDRGTADRPPDMQRVHTVRDLEYLQGMYPGHMKQIQGYVMAACDRLDYKNSPLYDEYPDRLMVNQMCDSVCRQVAADGILSGAGLGMQEPSEVAGEGNAETAEEAEEADAYEAEAYEAETYETEAYEAGGMAGPEADWRVQQVMPQGSQPWGPPPRPPQGPPPWGPPPRPQPQPPRPPQGPPPWGPPQRPQPQPPRPPQGPPPWGPPQRPQPQPPRPPQGPPPWGPPPRPQPQPPRNPVNNWLNDIVKVLLLNEMHRRRCRSGFCL